MTQLFTLKWEDHQKHVTSSLLNMREDSDFFDVTLMGADNCKIQAHMIILAAGSYSFRDILKNCDHSHPLIYMNGMTQKVLNNILLFIYEGKVDIPLEDVTEFLEIAKDMKVIGLESFEQQALQHEISNELIQENVFETPTKNVVDSKEDNSVIKLCEEEPGTFEAKSESIDNDTEYSEVKWTPEVVKNMKINKTSPDGNDHLTIKINQRKMVRRHYEISSQMSTFECENCGKFFKDKTGKLKHVRNIHMIKDKPIPCPRAFCGLLFQTYEMKLEHIKSCFLMCKVENCEKQFTREDKYEAHRRAHLMPSYPKKTTNHLHSAQDVKDFLKISKDLQFIGLAHFEQPALQNEISNELIQETTFERSTENVVKRKEDNIVMELCEEEPKTFKAKSEVIDNDTENSENKCENCGKLCRDKHNKLRHVRTVHMIKDKPITCPRAFCGLLFQTYEMKLEHIKSCFLMCKVGNCEKQFTREDKYDAHRRAHLMPSYPKKTTNPLPSAPIDMDKTAERLKGIWDSINS